MVVVRGRRERGCQELIGTSKPHQNKTQEQISTTGELPAALSGETDETTAGSPTAFRSDLLHWPSPTQAFHSARTKRVIDPLFLSSVISKVDGVTERGGSTEGGLYLRPRCHYPNDSALRRAAMEAILLSLSFCVSLLRAMNRRMQMGIGAVEDLFHHLLHILLMFTIN